MKELLTWADPFLRAGLAAESRKIGDFVPQSARDAIEAVLAKPKLLPPALVNEIASQDAMEQLLGDVLFDTIKTFSNNVFDFMVGLAPGLVRKPMQAMKGEFDKRIDPEIRRFLGVASRQGLKRGAAFLLAHQDDPSFVAFRKHMFHWVLERPVNELLQLPVDSNTVVTIAEKVLSDADVKRRIDDAFQSAPPSLAALRALLF